MKRSSILKFVSATAALGLVMAMAAPQSGPLGKRGGGGGHSGGSSGGGSSSGGGGGHHSGGGGVRTDPPQRGGGGGSRGGGNSGGSSSGSTSDQVWGRRSGGGGGWNGGGPSRPGDQSPNNGTRRNSRSGQVHYGTNGNLWGRVNGGSVRIQRAPVIINNGQLQRRINNSERVGLVRNGYRWGYYHYNRSWRDDSFWYPHYAFDPFAFDRCVISPWYYYVSLPPYLNYNRVTIINVYPTTNWYGHPYRWRSIDEGDRGNYSDIDYAIQDIRDAFEDGNRRAIDRLCPRNGNINIYSDGNYDYSLGANDFYDLYNDGIENVRTRRYVIENVEVNDAGNVRIFARHEYTDPWGNDAVVFHTYYLERSGRDYVIREFGTTQDRNRW